MFALIRGPSGRVMTVSPGLKASQLRRLIPAELLTVMLAEAAVTGVYRKFDLETGEEVGAAEPVPQAERIRLAERLLDKRLPSQKAAEAEVEQTAISDLAKIPLDLEEIKRMTLTEMGSIIEATFTPTSSNPIPPQDSMPLEAEAEGAPHAEP